MGVLSPLQNNRLIGIYFGAFGPHGSRFIRLVLVRRKSNVFFPTEIKLILEKLMAEYIYK